MLLLPGNQSSALVKPNYFHRTSLGGVGGRKTRIREEQIQGDGMGEALEKQQETQLEGVSAQIFLNPSKEELKDRKKLGWGGIQLKKSADF